MNFEYLVKAAQTGNKKEMEEIIMRFKPLILKMLSLERYKNITEDLYSTLSLEIVSLTLKYKGPCYKTFPGYIKKMLTFSANNLMRTRAKIKHFETTSIDTIADALLADDYEEQLTSHLALENALKNLSHKERYIICEYYLKNKTDEEVGQALHVSKQYVNKIRRQTLRKMRKDLGTS